MVAAFSILCAALLAFLGVVLSPGFTESWAFLETTEFLSPSSVGDIREMLDREYTTQKEKRAYAACGCNSSSVANLYKLVIGRYTTRTFLIRRHCRDPPGELLSNQYFC